MLPIKVTHSGVLIIRLQADLDIGSRAATSWAIDGLLAAHRSSPVVLELSGAVLSPAAVSTVVRAIRVCRDAGTAAAVVASGAEARRALGLAAGAHTPDVHATVPLAVAALSPTLGAAA
ncbi:STAS domain-containing protein [Streptomyces sp. NPDC048257]|uniref:STAS domain-containing protein n=1 Tax=Streptomyces sp. NPDC048257 TaxID=3365526 RepID=UPI00371AEA62